MNACLYTTTHYKYTSYQQNHHFLVLQITDFMFSINWLDSVAESQSLCFTHSSRTCKAFLRSNIA